MTDIELKVLHSLNATAEGYCLPFAPICEEWGLDRKAVRRACRSLARKGLARYARGLWTEDGEVAGAGYGLTLAGADALAELQD